MYYAQSYSLLLNYASRRPVFFRVNIVTCSTNASFYLFIFYGIGNLFASKSYFSRNVIGVWQIFLIFAMY